MKSVHEHAMIMPSPSNSILEIVETNADNVIKVKEGVGNMLNVLFNLFVIIGLSLVVAEFGIKRKQSSDSKAKYRS